MKRLFIAMLVLAFSFTVLAQEKKSTTTAPTVREEKTQIKQDHQTMQGQKEMKGGAMHKEMKEKKSHAANASKEMKEKHAKKEAHASTKMEMKKESTKIPEKK